MSEEEEHCTDVDISDIIDDSENIGDSEFLGTEVTDSELSIIQDSENINSEETASERKVSNTVKVDSVKSTRLPMSRIKNIMKMDPDELFLETIAKETYSYTVQHKRKTISKKDLEVVINKVDCLCFLEGAMDF
ncbi:DNA polymerase epsilon subunit 4 isoform X2 [Danaus plexippus]|uniref:DNA polymerase epsilon subunit 4 isoform X2 n=1 Tax=Danaus plexippus TaxID=13037 RepID=UPI002AB18A47|nr:DNA polymerase epsilon subunit 4 isoform X2 [Danaus plexippus]